MQKLAFWGLALLAFCFLGTACDHHHDEEDTTDPVLTITSPTAGVLVTGGVGIAGVVSDESLHEMSIVVTKDSDGSELFKATPEVHDLKNYAFSEVWNFSPFAAETPVTLTITVEDHSEHKVTQTVHFKVN